MKILLLAALVAFILSVVAGKITIPLLKRLKVGQPILSYVTEHKEKNGTPTMGGLFFITSAVIVFFIFGKSVGRLSIVAVSIGVSFMLVGFLDDFIKIKMKRNEGLKAYQKIIFQTAIAAVAGFFAYKNGLTIFHVPFFNLTVSLGFWTIPLVALIFIAITNSVNLTDGLDGLAGSVSAVYLLFLAALITVQSMYFGASLNCGSENNSLLLLCFTLFGAICGFLIYNTSKAKVFMGDCGSLSLGGFIGAISIFSSNSFFIVVLGIVFVWSSVSVIAQVLYYKKTKKRVFLMAPFHHHLQMKGYSESKIAFIYSAITSIMGALSVISYL